jgi:hypothetical protein
MLPDIVLHGLFIDPNCAYTIASHQIYIPQYFFDSLGNSFLKYSALIPFNIFMTWAGEYFGGTELVAQMLKIALLSC